MANRRAVVNGEEGMSETGSSKLRAGWRGGLVAALAIIAVGAGPAAAMELYRGDQFSATLDTTLSAGAAMRVEGRDNALIYLGNNPKKPGSGSTAGFFSQADDGNLNYNKSDFYSANVKGTFELETDYRTGWDYLPSIGSFFRATTFYDFVGNDANSTQRTDLDSRTRYRSSVTEGGIIGTQWTFLDMYVDGSFDVMDRYLTVRLGNQVINWGEGLFNPGGVASTNAIDVTKIRIPGSRLREALLPAPMIRLSADLAEGFGLETYYQFYWNYTLVDPTGSYWSTNDMVARGTDGMFTGNDSGSGLPEEQLGRVPKASSDKPSNQGQFGVALRYYADTIMTEFGAYYLRYHSKTPVVGFAAQFGAPTSYYKQYADDIDLIGASFSSELLASMFAGEITYRWSDPTPIVATGEAMAASVRGMQGGNMDPVRARGYVREERIQGALVMISTFGPSTRLGVGDLVEALAVDSVSLTTELAFVNYPDLDKQCASPFDPFFDAQQGKVSNYCTPYAGVGPPDTDDIVGGSFPVKSDVNATSAGYQMYLRGEYTNPLDIPVTLNPVLAWRHDFHGTAPNQTFIENRKAISLGLTVDYLQVYGAGITYSNFFGGGRNHLTHDRDFLSLSFTYRL